MITTVHLAAWSDEHGNRIEYGGAPRTDVVVTFRGSNNRLVVNAKAKIAPGQWNFSFEGSNGVIKVGAGRGLLRPSIRVGQDSEAVLGRNVTSTSKVIITAAEGAKVRIGDDVMLASGVEVRADDAHPIFDIRSGKRVNASRNIVIGSHVWLAGGVVVLGGVKIGEGTVVGVRSVVTKSLPNNVIAAGAPAAVIRRDIAWERDHLTLSEPAYKPDASSVVKTGFWRLTGDSGAFGHRIAAGPAQPKRLALATRAKRRLKRLLLR